MVKKKTTHKAKAHKAKAEKVENKKEEMSSLKTIIPTDTNSLVTFGIFLLIGLIVGAMVTYGAFLADNSVNETNNVSTGNLALVKQGAQEYLNTYLLNPTAKAEGVEFILSDEEDLGNGLYEFAVYVDQDGQEQLIAYVYSTEDRLILGQGQAIDLTAEPEFPEVPQTTVPVEENQEFSEEEKQEIISFNECLGEKGIKIYGANWCGYTKALVENLGGYNLVGTTYIECTENTELCAENQITGYPTILLNGEKINPERSFEGLSGVTGCTAPIITQTAPVATGSC